MSQVNYNGMRKRDTYDEIVQSLENDKLKLIYPDRAASFILNSQQVSNIKYGTGLDVDEMNEKLNKTKIIEHIVQQMSSNTNTHHTYNNYHFKPSPDVPAAGVDHNMDDGFDRQKFHSAQEVNFDGERRKAKRDQNTETAKAHLKSTVTQTEAEAAADAYASNNFSHLMMIDFTLHLVLVKRLGVELRKYLLVQCVLILFRLMN